MQLVQWMFAAITATFVAAVAFLQWRTAQQKAVLDLFERRHAIYEVVHNAILTMASNSPAFDQKRDAEFLQTMERAYFFFGDDVVAYLERLWSAIIDIRDADKELNDSRDADAKSAALTRRREGMNCVRDFHSIGKPLFARYMRFAQTAPTNAARGWRGLCQTNP